MNKNNVSNFVNLSATELRNIEQVQGWAAAYSVPGGSATQLVDAYYSEAPEVISVLTDTHVARKGLSKKAWRDAELRTHKLVTSRRIVFAALHACGAVVTVEGRIEQLLKDGTKRDWPFAAVLFFDATGRIERDHTYMMPPPHQREFELAAELLSSADGSQRG